jgi:hypothetical protein
MKNARPIRDEASAPSTGSTIVSSGYLPIRKATVCAEVLCRTLNGEVLTGMDAVFAASTTRLAAHIGYLEDKYCWTFQRGNKVVGCKDGRVQIITTYWLSPSAIEHAAQRDSAVWCLSVRVARAAKRTQAAQAQELAQRFNRAREARLQNMHPGLFDALP